MLLCHTIYCLRTDTPFFIALLPKLDLVGKNDIGLHLLDLQDITSVYASVSLFAK